VAFPKVGELFGLRDLKQIGDRLGFACARANRTAGPVVHIVIDRGPDAEDWLCGADLHPQGSATVALMRCAHDSLPMNGGIAASCSPCAQKYTPSGRLRQPILQQDAHGSCSRPAGGSCNLSHTGQHVSVILSLR